MRERDRQRHRQREKQALCREPNVGLNPGTPGSCPGPKAGGKPLSHPGVPLPTIFKAKDLVSATYNIMIFNSNHIASDQRTYLTAK